MLALNFVHLIIECASRYPRVPLIRNSIFAWNVPFSHLRSHIIAFKWLCGSVAKWLAGLPLGGKHEFVDATFFLS